MMTSARVAALTNRFLPHTCTLLAPGAETGHDPYEEGIDAPDTATTGVACWCYQPPAQGEVVEPGMALVAHEWRVMVGAGIPATEAMLVANVRDEAGTLIVQGPLAITEIIRHRGHLTLIAPQAISGTVAP